jgi:Peptidase A4 family
MRRRAVGVAVAVGGVAVGLMGSASAASATTAAPSRIVLAPNHHVSAKPGGGHGGGGGSTWPGWSSSNWSGYAVARGPYTAASGSWTVPAVTRTRGNTYSAAWVGVGGFNDAALIQTGTEQDFVNGQAHYAAWWTTDAQGYAEQPIPMTVQPGDVITASVVESHSGVWTITLHDVDGNQTFTTSPTGYANPGLSAEWIMEAPGVGGRQSTIAQYGSDVFDPGSVNGNSSPGLTPVDGGVLVQKSAIVSIPSNPDSDADGFVIAHGSSQPSPPAAT